MPLNLLVSGLLQVGGGQQQQSQQPAQQQPQQQSQQQQAQQPPHQPLQQQAQNPPLRASTAAELPPSEPAVCDATQLETTSTRGQAARPAAAAAGSSTQAQQPRPSLQGHGLSANGHGSTSHTLDASDARSAAAYEPARTPAMPSTAFAAAAEHSAAPAPALTQPATSQPHAVPTAAAAVQAAPPAAAEAVAVAAGTHQELVAASALQPEPTLALHDNDFDMYSLAPAATYSRDTQAAGGGYSAGSGPAASVPGHAASTPGPQRAGTYQPATGQRSASGLSTGAGGATDANARWASVEAASTVLSSPPSSVVISTEPGSPPAEVAPDRPPASSARAPTARLPLTIRTGPITPAAGGLAVVHASEAQQAAARAGALERQGSLHEGGDIWIGDAVSPTSSDSSDFLGGGGGIIVHRSTHGAPGDADGSSSAAGPRCSNDGDRAGLTASRAVLQELQEQLQIHLIAPSIAQRESAAATAHSAAASSQAAAAAAAAAAALDDDWRPRGAAVPAPTEWIRPAQTKVRVLHLLGRFYTLDALDTTGPPSKL